MVWGRAYGLSEGLEIPAAGDREKTDGGHHSSGGRAEGDAANGDAADEGVRVGEHPPSCSHLDPHYWST